MSRSFSQAMASLEASGSGARTAVKFTTIQNDGLVSYGSGLLYYRPAPSVGRPASLFTSQGTHITYYFDNRTGPQPFHKDYTDKIELRVYQTTGPLGPTGDWEIEFKLLSWDNVVFKVPVKEEQGFLIGTGPSIPGHTPRSPTAMYVFAFPVAPAL